jgi:hypothetical protein
MVNKETGGGRVVSEGEIVMQEGPGEEMWAGWLPNAYLASRWLYKDYRHGFWQMVQQGEWPHLVKFNRALESLEDKWENLASGYGVVSLGWLLLMSLVQPATTVIKVKQDQAINGAIRAGLEPKSKDKFDDPPRTTSRRGMSIKNGGVNKTIYEPNFSRIETKRVRHEIEVEMGVDESLAIEERLSDKERYDQWLLEVVAMPPEIGGRENYDVPLGVGLGFVTYYGKDEAAGVANLIYRGLLAQHRFINSDDGVLEPRWENILRLTAGIEFKNQQQLLSELNENQADYNEKRNWIISDYLRYQTAHQPRWLIDRLMELVVESQAHLTEVEALASDQIIGFVATRSPQDVGRKFLVYQVEGWESVPVWVGVVLAVDSASRVDWYGYEGLLKGRGLHQKVLSHPRFNQALAWMGDMSFGVYRQLPVVAEGLDKLNTNRPRVGVLLVDEEKYREMVPESGRSAREELVPE